MKRLVLAAFTVISISLPRLSLAQNADTIAKQKLTFIACPFVSAGLNVVGYSGSTFYDGIVLRAGEPAENGGVYHYIPVAVYVPHIGVGADIKIPKLGYKVSHVFTFNYYRTSHQFSYYKSNGDTLQEKYSQNAFSLGYTLQLWWKNIFAGAGLSCEVSLMSISGQARNVDYINNSYVQVTYPTNSISYSFVDVPLHIDFGAKTKIDDRLALKIRAFADVHFTKQIYIYGLALDLMHLPEGW